MKLTEIFKEITIFVNLGNTNAFSGHNILDIFCDFFQKHGRFSGSRELIIVPRSEIPNFIKLRKQFQQNYFIKNSVAQTRED